MMDDRSYDDTEPTPQPTAFRPPPPFQHPRPTSVLSRDIPDASLLERSLFSFSIDSALDALDVTEREESLPSLPQEPPSPLSRPSSSIFGDDHSFHPTPKTTLSAIIHTRVPSISEVHPISEVHMNHEEDSFFECFEDRSLAQRTQRTLIQTPESKKKASSNSITSSTQNNSQARRQPNDTTTSQANASANNAENKNNNPSLDDVARVHDSALQALMRLKEELIKSNERNQTLERALTEDRNRFLQQFQAQESKAQGDSFRLAETTATLQLQMEEFVREKQEWTSKEKELDAKLRAAARDKKEYMHRKLAADNRQKELRSQLDKIKTELEEALGSKVELASDLGFVQNEKLDLERENAELAQQVEAFQSQEKATVDSTIGSLRLEMEQKDKEIYDLKTTLGESSQEFEEMKSSNQQLRRGFELTQKEVDKLKAALQAANESIRGRSSSLRSPSSPSRRITPPSFANSSSSVRFQTEGSPFDPSSISSTTPRVGVADGTTLDHSIADRLARMRDSAERAHLIRAHKRELSRLKLDKDAEIKKLVTAQEDTLRKALKQADAKMNVKLDDMRKALTEEYEEKLEEIEARHTQKFEEMQQEFLRNQEEADDSLRASLSKVANTTHQCEREVSRRETVERSLDQLNHQLDRDKQQLQARHAEELANRRAEWEMERDTLLTVIQKDCNASFERHRSISSSSSIRSRPSPPRHTTSPTAVVEDSDEYFSKLTVDTGRPEASPSRMSPSRRTTSMISPAYSDIDSVLRETEDLIQSIM